MATATGSISLSATSRYGRRSPSSISDTAVGCQERLICRPEVDSRGSGIDLFLLRIALHKRRVEELVDRERLERQLALHLLVELVALLRRRGVVVDDLPVDRVEVGADHGRIHLH